ncbi:hypothetical protein BDP81DRAFT_410208 [Colletotrichum phormii]|uniref:Uncharacterized protein n=1 Tax=Colletotrichum phormii TaxID=359342 RepID=A0AAJ0E9T3_9PEZI|nr:uncharacterized protein BDP81DRAFT_410208 [Colletotrichum phormii]KAK1623896.1 hypothetical protein BDP81DRAFT_410208 [Colletotrichum phormii]
MTDQTLPRQHPHASSHTAFKLPTVASHQSRDVEEEEPEYLPYPATKLIIAQYWHCSRDPPFWGYLIVGTFYDQHNNIVWSTEIFAFQRDTRGDRRHDDDDDDEQFVEFSDSDSNTGQDLNDRFSRSLNLAQTGSAYHQPSHVPTYEYRTRPHHLWDPSHAGPVPGTWITEFNHGLGNWVNTWQPNHNHHI